MKMNYIGAELERWTIHLISIPCLVHDKLLSDMPKIIGYELKRMIPFINAFI